MPDHAKTEGRLPPWLPFTLRGAAGFAAGPVTRWFLVAATVALSGGAAAAAAFWLAWVPVIEQAIGQLPADSYIRGGELSWPAEPQRVLAGNDWLVFEVDWNQARDFGRPADLLVEFGRQEVRLVSLLGYLPLSYPKGWLIELNRARLWPWWGAWKLPLIAGVGLGAAWLLMVSWGALALVYAVPIRLLGFILGKEGSFPLAWRLGLMCTLPGALLMSAGLLLYGIARIGLVGLLLIAGVQAVVGCVYALISPIFLPRKAIRKATWRASRNANPFA